MADALVIAAIIALVTVAVALVRILHGPSRIDRMMAVQLLGSGGVTVLLLLAVATDTAALIDVALTLALLAAFASITLATALARKTSEGDAS